MGYTNHTLIIKKERKYMKVTKKQIEKLASIIRKNGYLPEEVDEFFDMILENYEQIGNSTFPNPNAQVHISSNFVDGASWANDVEYEGTIDEWISIENKGIYADIPYIVCKDGGYVQKL